MSDQKTLYPVKVGTGNLVHAGYITRTTTVIIATKPVERHTYDKLCGSGNSTHFHNHRRATVRPLSNSTLEAVTCKHCLKAMKARG